MRSFDLMLLMIVVLVCDDVGDVECGFFQVGLNWYDPGFQYFILQEYKKGCYMVYVDQWAVKGTRSRQGLLF